MPNLTSSRIMAFVRLFSLSPWRLNAYVLAVVAVAVTALLRELLHPLLGSVAPMLLFVLPVFIVAWYGGFWPGVVAVVLALGTANYLFVEPRFAFGFPSNAEVVRAGM